MYVISHIFSHLLPFLYLGLIFVYYKIFFRKNKKLEEYTRYYLLALLIIHALEIIIRMIYLGALPFSTAFDALSFLAFSVLLVYFFIEMGAERKASGLFILAFAFLLVLVSSFSFNWQPITNELLGNQMYVLHATLGVIGYTALSISAIYALMYILQLRNMKKRTFNILFEQLMPLDYLEQLSIRSVNIGVIVLGIALLLSHFHLYTIFDKFWIADPKVIITDFIWLIYAVGLLISRFRKFPSRFMSYVSVFGFLFMFVSGIVIITIANSFHQFY